ncbi:response regulator transcription factor [Campylobacter coli]|uniref:DNA-binding response regulator n=2 Tax=Campylobacter coli TaxID=195 RepID=A0A3K4DKQ7_CAMCO|nr:MULTISPECIES: response regulator transcription factor [Campylobacter]EAI7420163.1 response regulator transcription factor [Campylobacter hyointestinalis]EAK5660558.1 response regulator transcription factor [Campylobacter fetus]KDA37305.1 chemotaxis protein CheY [Campylobacter jejuni K5]MCC3142984.1 response regulator transcription factor [Campylobacter jejuni]AGV09973.1 DNA-binding response regulator [Campylobacter coli CVM N29710]
MSKSKILIIEDDIDLNDLLSLRLKACDYQIFSLLDFKGVEDLLDSEQIDLLIVDRNLPSGDSLDRIKELRKQGYKEAVIFLTAKTLHQDLLEGFESGCDDYMCKPFDFNELLLRIKAILKRHKREEEKLVFKDFSLDLINYEFFYKNEKLDVSNLEYELLKCFFENPNTLLTRQFLSENVWKDDTTSDKTINIALTRLRNKFPKLKEHIISVRGIGYKIC